MIKIIAPIMIGLLAPVSCVLANGGPPGSGIESVKVFTTSGKSSATIYANGRMQAAINVIYNLADGYTLGDVEVKRLHTGEELENWFVAEKGNDFLHDIKASRSRRSAAFPPYVSSHKTLYLSTTSNDDESICVELTANKGGETSKFSTCKNDTNFGSVYLNVLPKKDYTINDFELTEKESEWGGPEGNSLNKMMRYTPRNFKLHSVDYNGANKTWGATKYVIGTKWFTQHNSELNGRSNALYLYAPNQGGISETLTLRSRLGTPRWEWDESESYSVNTTDSLVFSMMIGKAKKRNNMYHYGVLATPVNYSELTRAIYFYDTYGNKGEINFQRRSNGGYRDIEYYIY